VFEEGGAGDSIYHGGFGMINFQGIVKPSFHAYRLLQNLGEGEIARNDTAIATRDKKTGKVVLLAWNYPEETTPQAIPMSPYPDRSIAEAAQNSGEAKTLSIRGEGFGAGAEFLLEILDKEHGNAIEAWKKMGCPEPPTREQTGELGAVSWNTVKQSVHAGKDGVLQLDLAVQPWNLVLIKEL
jgi:xylan 1,4-beta-xylosidase